MTYEQVKYLLTICEAEWPQSYRGMGKELAKVKLDTWAAVFSDDDFALACAAVKALMVSGDREFAPGAGQIKAQMAKLTSPETMSEGEAWNRITAAIRNSAYGAAEEYRALPPILRRLVGSPNQLREWARMESGTLHSVVASNVQRAYRTVRTREQEQAALPADVRALVASIAAGKAMDTLPTADPSEGAAEEEAPPEKRQEEPPTEMPERVRALLRQNQPPAPPRRSREEVLRALREGTA